MGIDFYITNKKIDIFREKSVKFNEVLQGFLQNEEDYFKRYKEERLNRKREIGLDQYADKLFLTQEIHQLVNVCECLVSKYETDNLYGEEIKELEDVVSALAVKLTTDEINRLEEFYILHQTPF